MKKYWKDSSIRAVKTMAQTAVSLIGTNTVGITEVDWMAVLSVSALAGIVSLLMSVVNMPTEEEEE
ncbi:MAG: holin [Eubacteriaceae bacterium]|nr:holin [Eubacteriaceae bacterium]